MLGDVTIAFREVNAPLSIAWNPGTCVQVCPEDAQLNDEALRIISAYSTLKGVKIWIITEATDGAGQRAATTILLPSEY